MPVFNKLIYDGTEYTLGWWGNIWEPLNLTVTASWLDATITWEDNEIWTIPPTTFQKSELVRKIGSAPTSPSDWDLVVTETVKDTYKVSGYVDSWLTDWETYYYRVFSYSDLGGISYCDAVNVTPTAVPTRPTITGFSYDNALSSYTWWDVNWMTWKPDGTKFYITWEQNNTVYQYSVSTPRDVTTATYDNKNVATTLNVSNSIIFSDDGLTMWIGWSWGTWYVYKWTLSTAWDVSTASYSWDTSNISFDQCTGYWMANNWQYLFVLSRWNRWIRRYTMLTPYDITTLDATYQEYSNLLDTCHKVLLNPQWTQLFYYARDYHKIHICALSTAFDLTSLSETSQYTITTPNTNDITSVTIDNSWNSMWIWWYNIGSIYQYTTTTV
jgi:hypothetical protein